MKRLIKTGVIFFTFLIFITASFAAETNYKLDSNGNYSVAEAYCTYKYTVEGFFGTSVTYKFRINVEDAKLVDPEYVNSKATGLEYGTLKYRNLFNNQKQFSCPENVDVRLKTSGGSSIETACNKDLLDAGTCNRATLIPEESRVTYNIRDENDPEPEDNKTATLVCSYNKQTSSGNGTTMQNASPSTLIYYKYDDGSQEFIDSNNEHYEISEGSLSNCEALDIYLRVDGVTSGIVDSYKIVSGACNDNSNGSCVVYRKENFASENVDSGLNEDGTSDNAADLADPSTIPTFTTDLAFDTSDGCNSYLGDVNDDGSIDGQASPAYYLNFAFNIIKYVVIVLLFVLTIVDLAKAIPSGKPEELKKVGTRAIKRLIIAVVIFFLPTLINFILELLGVITDNNMCNIGS